MQPFDIVIALFGVGLAVSGGLTIVRGSFVGGNDGESRTYSGSEALIWGAVHLLLGASVLAMVFFMPEQMRGLAHFLFD